MIGSKANVLSCQAKSSEIAIDFGVEILWWDQNFSVVFEIRSVLWENAKIFLHRCFITNF